MEQKPSVGRIVHFVFASAQTGVEGSGKCYAALVTDVSDDGKYPTLAVFRPDKEHVGTVYSVMYSEEKETCSWHWPERT